MAAVDTRMHRIDNFGARPCLKCRGKMGGFASSAESFAHEAARLFGKIANFSIFAMNVADIDGDDVLAKMYAFTDAAAQLYVQFMLQDTMVEAQGVLAARFTGARLTEVIRAHFRDTGYENDSLSDLFSLQ